MSKIHQVDGNPSVLSKSNPRRIQIRMCAEFCGAFNEIVSHACIAKDMALGPKCMNGQPAMPSAQGHHGIQTMKLEMQTESNFFSPIHFKSQKTRRQFNTSQ